MQNCYGEKANCVYLLVRYLYASLGTTSAAIITADCALNPHSLILLILKIFPQKVYSYTFPSLPIEFPRFSCLFPSVLS